MQHKYFHLFLNLIIISSILFISTTQSYSQANPRIQAMVDSVTVESITGLVEDICDFYPRTSTSSGCDDATKWAQELFLAAGFDSVYMDKYNSSDAPNVIAVLKGDGNTDTAYAVSGHIDAVSGTVGADDDASGSSITIRCALVMAANEYRHDLRFCLFSAEESGMKGSKDYAAKCKNGILRGLVNFDMMGYSRSFPNDLDLTFHNSSSYGSEWMADSFIAASEMYVPDFVTDKHNQNQTTCSSDHKSFWSQGIPALSGMEEKGCCSVNPYYHTSNDKIGMGLNDFDLTTNTAKVTVAALANLAGIKEPTEVAYTKKVEMGNFIAAYNPVNRLIELSLPENINSNISISIFDLQGRRVVKINKSHIQPLKNICVKTDSFANGMYYVTVATGSWKKTNKIVLSR